MAWDGKLKMQLYTSISEYWNNSNAAFPTFVPQHLYIHRDIRTIARNTTFFTVSRPFFPTKRWNGQTRTVCGKRRLKATVRNSSPFVEYQAGANRCLQLRSGTEIPHDPWLPHLFSLLHALCLYPMAWKAAVISIQRTSAKDGICSIDLSTNSSSPAACGCDWWENCAVRAREWENRIPSGVYISMSISEHSVQKAVCGGRVLLNHEIGKGR